MKNRLASSTGIILAMLLSLTMAGCMVLPNPPMNDSMSYVRQHKGEGMRRPLMGSETDLMGEVVKQFEGVYTVEREPQALFVKATSVDLSYAYYFYPSAKSGHTDVEVLIASPWLKPEALQKFQSDAFQTIPGYINARLLEDGYDPNVKEGSMLPLSAAAFFTNRETTLKLLKKGARQELAITELNDIVTRNLPYLDSPANRTSHDKARAAIGFLNGLATEKFTTERTVERTTELKALIDKNDLVGLRAYLDAHPEMLATIEDPQLRLRFTGPAELRVTDIVQLVKNKKKDALIIARINSTQAPYKQFTVDEMTQLTEMGISDEIVAAMIAVTTEYNKEQKRLAEQQQVQARQAAPAQQTATQPVNASVQEQPPEANSPTECLKLIAALKACDQSGGGFIGTACKSLARTQFNCPRL